jgi:hypothetical protein
MALIDMQQVIDLLPADGSAIPYEDMLNAAITKIGVQASRTILAAKKKGLTKTELVVNADSSSTLYISRRVQGEAKSAVTLSDELAKQATAGIRAATTRIKKEGA